MSKKVGMSLDTADGKVIIEFDMKVQWLEMSPVQAIEFAQAIAQKALSLNPKAVTKTDEGIIIPNVMN